MAITHWSIQGHAPWCQDYGEPPDIVVAGIEISGAMN